MSGNGNSGRKRTYVREDEFKPFKKRVEKFLDNEFPHFRTYMMALVLAVLGTAIAIICHAVFS